MSEYAGRQFVGIDLHRRRTVLVRMTEAGETLECTRISNDPEYLRSVMARAGEDPEVVLEACYGWYWAVDTLAELGANVHLAHPLGVKGFAYRRVKNDPLTELRQQRSQLSGRILVQVATFPVRERKRRNSAGPVPLCGAALRVA